MKSNSATHICKICFKPIKENGLRSLIFPRLKICRSCHESLKPSFIRYKTLGVKCLSIYFYNDKIRSLLYQFKGTLDYELKSSFLSYIIPLLKIIYKGYIVIPAPSSEEIDKKRGFNQVIEMFKELKLPYLKAIKKTCKHIQHEGNTEARKKVKNVLAWVPGVNIRNKKVLIVDDVYTTGSTIKACINLVKKHYPKKIKVLTMTKTKDICDRDN